MGARLTVELAADLRSRLRAGQTVRQIAEAGYNPKTIRYHAKRMGLSFKRGRPRIYPVIAPTELISSERKVTVQDGRVWLYNSILSTPEPSRTRILQALRHLQELEVDANDQCENPVRQR